MEIAKNQIDTTAKRRLSVSLYLNYLVHGMGLIILAQNMNSLGTAWNQPIKIVSFVISGIGIGRLISYLITGFLSDKISRKFFLVYAMDHDVCSADDAHVRWRGPLFAFALQYRLNHWGFGTVCLIGTQR